MVMVCAHGGFRGPLGATNTAWGVRLSPAVSKRTYLVSITAAKAEGDVKDRNGEFCTQNSSVALCKRGVITHLMRFEL